MKATMFALLFLSAAGEAAAQARPETRSYNGNYYVTAFMGGCQHGYGLFGGGAGAEGLLWKGLSIGGEASYQTFTDGWGLTYLTVQPGYHFRGKNRASKWDPFVTMGMGLAIGNRGGYGGTANIGGGANYWFKDKMAVRFSVRMQGIAEEGMVVGSIGISFR